MGRQCTQLSALATALDAAEAALVAQGGMEGDLKEELVRADGALRGLLERQVPAPYTQAQFAPKHLPRLGARLRRPTCGLGECRPLEEGLLAV